MVCTPLFCWKVGGGGGAEPPIKFLKRGAWQDLNFYIKSELKSEIFNEKFLLTKMFSLS